MTAAEYDMILCPSDADFKAFTETLFARADRINALIVQKYPHLFKTKSADGLPLGL